MEKNYFNSVDKLDISSLILLIIGIVLLIYSFLDVFRGNYPVLIAIPATYCVYVGLTHLTKKRRNHTGNTRGREHHKLGEQIFHC